MTNPKVKVIVLRTAGTNCDEEAAFAFSSVGAQAELVHINRLFAGETKLADYHILVIPGGFTYGDDIMSGRILANELRLRLGEQIGEFVDDGKLIIGICNGFQVLVRAGLLPGGIMEDPQRQTRYVQTVSLTYNDSGKFEDRWVYLKPGGKSVWTEGIKDIIYVPVAHGEGKFVPKDEQTLNELIQGGQVIFRYCDKTGQKGRYPVNPNGSADEIAGIADKTGRILGMMPHPERHFLFTQHPFWTRLPKKERFGDGAKIFENGVRYVKEQLLKVKV